MAHMYNRVVSVITKNYDQRKDEDLLPLVPWFSKKTKLFESMKQDILLDILRYCDFSVRSQDDVIIRQGDRGDCFYIILSGKVSIYINTEGVPELTEDANEKPEKLDRTKLGRYIAPLDAGKAFGELALINKDCVRNASIVADEKTDLVVIDRELYNRSLRAAQEAELKQRQDFVNACPLFENWQAKYKKQVGMSLRREILPFDAPIVKQGAPLDGLHFIVKGQAKVIVDAAMHELQYPSILTQTDPDEVDRFAAIDELLGHPLRKSQTVTNAEEMNEEHSLRSSRKLKSSKSSTPALLKAKRVYEVALIGSNEIIGDIEQSLGVPTYMHTVVCTQPTEIFVLDAKNYERLVMGKNNDTIAMLQEMARIRLRSKLLRSLDSCIPVIRCFMFRLQAMRKLALAQDGAPELLVKQHSKGLLTIDDFIPHRGPVIDFYGPGTVFYRNKKLRGKRRYRRVRHDPLTFDEDTTDGMAGFLTPNTGSNSANNSFLMTSRSDYGYTEIKSPTSSDFETSDEHLLQLERRIREWYSSIKRDKSARMAVAVGVTPEDTVYVPRGDDSSAQALQALQLRRLEPNKLAVVKPGARVRLHRRPPRDPDALGDSDDDASTVRNLRTTVHYTSSGIKPSSSQPVPSDKKLSVSEYEMLRSLLKQKEREFVHRRAPVL